MGAFDYFVVYAGMRTGSNFLEENLNAIDGLTCWGEAFNPVFVGHSNRQDMAGVSMAARDAAPGELIGAMQAQTDGLAGFRFFQDHDHRVLDTTLADRGCAKVILTRNPLDSYVSLKIARETGQWRLGNVRHAKSAQARFDKAEFDAHLRATTAFHERIRRQLQTSGQTGFFVDYDDLQDVAVVNGLAAFLGASGRLDSLVTKTKVQNPRTLAEKVSNHAEMIAALGEQDSFGTARTLGYEPRRGPNVPTQVLAAWAPLRFLPMAGAPAERVEDWMAALDGVPRDRLQRGLTQNGLRQWMRAAPGHLSFTVLRHPVDRLHGAFCRLILPDDLRPTVRRTLADSFGVTLPGPDSDTAAHRAAFLGFLDFVRANLRGQTALGVDRHWATQATLLAGMCAFMPPDLVLREDGLETGLSRIADDLGLPAVPVPATGATVGPVALADIHGADIEGAARAAHGRDYDQFGFSDWRPTKRALR